jgi:ABC-2 type transport system ATP-binding protein
MVVPFGMSLHVSGTNADAIERSLEAIGRRPGVAVRRVHASLEDVFIHLMER